MVPSVKHGIEMTPGEQQLQLLCMQLLDGLGPAGKKKHWCWLDSKQTRVGR